MCTGGWGRETNMRKLKKYESSIDTKWWMPANVGSGMFTNENLVTFADTAGNLVSVFEDSEHTRDGVVAVAIMGITPANVLIQIQNCNDLERHWVPKWWDGEPEKWRTWQ
jgi:hypothetical protein